MLAITDPEDAYELHMNLIRHGREICRPKPRCGECALRRMCPWFRARAGERPAGSISAPVGGRPRGPAADMRKRPFVIFGLAVAVLAVLIPILAFRSNGDPIPASRKDVPASLETGKTSSRPTAGPATPFTRRAPTATSGPTSTCCWPPPARRAGDTIKAKPGLNAIHNGVDRTTPGRMPAGIISGQQADQVAEFVANVAGQVARPAGPGRHGVPSALTPPGL